MNEQLRQDLTQFHKQQAENLKTIIESHEEAMTADRARLAMHERFIEGLEQKNLQLELGKDEQ